MGVPAFFSWLSRKYPSIVLNAIEQKQSNGGEVDATQPNPNFQEFDNFYVDINAIIHPCVKPEDRPPPKHEDEIFELIFDHIDRLFAIVRPRKLLYLAIDGVAPRAKMNQQRSRRFKASKENAEKQEKMMKIRNDLERQGVLLPPMKPKENQFDSNCISPGTPFMFRLAAAFRYYIHLRVNNNPAWKNIAVILSDASVPGEGEHKIIDFIRRQKASPSYDPNTKHCIAGPDADLIMLGLVTHEPNITILREDFSYLANRPVKCELCNQIGHNFKNCKGLALKSDKNNYLILLEKERKSNYLLVRLDILRNYLERDFRLLKLPFEFDLKCAIDDWVFLCSFVGNDFLPHLLSLDIYEGAINRLVGIYREVSTGWITENGNIRFDIVQEIMKELGKVEDEIFCIRYQNEFEPSAKMPKMDNNCDFENDPIRLWESGWKDRYYRQKFGVPESNVEFRQKVACDYVETVCWVFEYYCRCPSWDFYYPHHYAPFACDFDAISKLKVDWSVLTKPFLPFEQQMAILPAASKHIVPEGWCELMTSPKSPIYHFYPTEFEIDNYGTKFEGQGIALLPFVDKKLLLETLKDVYHTLTDEEKGRNIVGVDYLFVGKQNKMFGQLQGVYGEDKKWLPIEFCGGYKLVGEICYDSKAHEIDACIHSVFICSSKYRRIPKNNCIMLAYKNPKIIN